MNELPAYMLINLKKVSTKRVMVSCCFFFSLSNVKDVFFSQSSVVVSMKTNTNENSKNMKFVGFWVIIISVSVMHMRLNVLDRCLLNQQHTSSCSSFSCSFEQFGGVYRCQIYKTTRPICWWALKKITRLLVSLLLYHVNFTCWNERTVLRCPFSIAHTYRWSSVQSVSIHWPNHLLNLLYSRKSDHLQKTSATVLFYQFIQIIDRKKGFHIIHVGQFYGD